MISVFAILVVLAAPPPSGPVADDRHIYVPEAAGSDPARIFAEKIRPSQFRSDIESILKQIGPMQGAGLKDQLQKMMRDDPNLLKKATDLLKSKDPATQALVQAALAQAVKTNPDLAGLNLKPQELQQMLRDALGDKLPADGLPRLSDGPKKAGSLSAAAKPKWNQKLAEWAKAINQNEGLAPLRKSEAVNRMVQEMASASLETLKNTSDSSQLPNLSPSWQERIQSALDSLPDRIPQSFKDQLAGFKWDAGNLKLPDLAMSGGMSGPGVPDVGSAADWMFPLSLIAGAGGLVYFLHRRGMLGFLPSARRKPDPLVLPKVEVGNPRDVIEAFESLAVYRLGESARTSHHRETVRQLGQVEAHREAAERIGALYEMARYMPSPPELSAREIDTVRRDLASLAGHS